MPKPRRTHCMNGHLLEGNTRIRANGSPGFCKTCAENWRKAYRKLHRERDRFLQRRRNAKNRENKAYRSGYTKNVLQIVGRDMLTEAFDAVRETGEIRSTYTILGNGNWHAGRSRWDAIQFFYPAIHKQVAKIVGTRKQEIKAKIIKPAKPALIRLMNADFVDRISTTVSRSLSRDHRDDVIADMVEAVLTGNLKPEDIERRVSEFVCARFKLDHNKHGDLSLDVPIHVDGSATLLDRLSTDVDTGYWDVNMMASTGWRK